MRERWGWLLRHYGMQRLAVFALAWPIYQVTWWVVQLTGYGLAGSSHPAVAFLATGSHDVWFGFWVASVSTPLLWIASYRVPVLKVQWGFRVIVFTWLFDGLVAIGQGLWLMRGSTPVDVATTLLAWACGTLLPIAVGFLPWGLLELWGLMTGLPLVKRWLYSGVEEHAEWISPRKLSKQTQPLPGRLWS